MKNDNWLFGFSIGCLMATIALLIAFLFSGCTGMLIGNALQQGQNLTSEQIDAYNKVGSKVYGCFQFGGPGPAGNTIWLVLPKDATIQPRFGDNCHLLSQ